MVKSNIFFVLPYNFRRALFATLWNEEFKYFQKKRSIITKAGYSYTSFDRHQCIFVHIPKAAGVSISKTLFGNLAGGHTKISQYQIIFPKKEFEHYFKFTFVRNPWSRIFSTYNFLKQGGMNDNDRKWATANLAAYNNFDDFIKGWLNKKNIEQYIHFRPQYKYLCLPYRNKLFIDFLGFFENLYDDFEYVKKRLSLDDNLVLSHENKTFSDDKPLDYRDFYTNETRNIVSEVYKRDIELFGYNFDNSSLTKQLERRKSFMQ